MSKFELQTPGEFTLPDGRKIGIKPVSLARIRAAKSKAKKELEEDGLSFVCPSYPIPGVVVAPGVDTPTKGYDSVTILDAPEDVQREYAKYLAAKRQLDLLTAAHMLVTLILRGTEVEVPNSGWVEEHTADGAEIPENPQERYIYYMLNELLVPPILAQECAKQVMRVSLEGADPKVIQAFEGAFRNPIQDPGREYTRPGKGKAKKG